MRKTRFWSGKKRLPGRMRWAGLLAVTMITLVLWGQDGRAGAKVRWSYRPSAGYVDASPGVADLDGDGVLDLVLCTTAGHVVALDANGREKWKFAAGATLSVPPTVFRSADDIPRVVVLTNPGTAVCLDGRTGRRLWRYALPNDIVWGTTAIVAARLGEEEGSHLVLVDRRGRMVCLEENGKPRWLLDLGEDVKTAPAIGDVDGDGRPEILVGGERTPILWVSLQGEVERKIGQGKPVGSSPLICDLNGDGTGEILVGEDRGLSCYSASGRRMWHRSLHKPIHDAVAIADLDGDGKPEVLVVDLLGKLACLGADGSPRWYADVEERVRRSPTVADVDGDGQLEVLVAGYSAVLYAFAPDGELEEGVALKGPTNASPTIVDFRGDGRLAVVCATTAEVVCFEWPGVEAGTSVQREWSEYRVNSQRTGSLLRLPSIHRARLAEVDFGLLHVGSDRFRVRVANPARQKLTLRLVAQFAGEAPVTSSVTAADTSFEHELIYNVSGRSAQNLTLRAELSSRGKLLSKRERTFYLVPFAKEEEDIAGLVARTRELLPKVSWSRLVPEKLGAFARELEVLAKRARVAGSLNPLERSALRDDFAHLFREARRWHVLVKEAARASRPLVAYGANPWAPFGGAEELVEGRTAPAELLVEAFSGEKEAAAVNLAWFGDGPTWVRVEPEAVVCEADSSEVPARQVLRFFEVLPVPTQSLDKSADALPELNQANALLVPGWDVRQLWVRVDTSPLKPGVWTCRIRLRALEVEPPEAWITLRIRVWGPKLPEEQPIRLCQWGYVHRSVLKDQPEEALRDQVEHGTNVFVATAAFAPPAEFDREGRLVSGPDFSAHDRYVRKHSPHGIILFFAYQSRLKGPAEPFSPTWRKAYKAWISAWIEHLKGLGLGYEDFAFYPIDEPGLREGLVDRFIGYAQPIREVDPKALIYADPVGRASLHDLKRMAPYVDIWCPNRRGYLLHQGQEKLAFLKSTGKTVWTYECDGNAKHQSPLGYYRAQAWLAWYRGLKGIGFWSYCTSRYDPWYVPEGGADYLLIYQGRGVVTSKRWEAVRDGVEDFSMLWKLQRALEDAARKPGLATVVKEARRFLTEEVGKVAEFCGLDRYGTLPTARGPAFQRELEDRRWRTIQRIRRRLADLLQDLGVE